MANVVVSALATWNGKALKKAKQDVDVFSKQIKQFARVFGVAFSATALVAFSKKAVKAFAEDEAAAKSLALQLENTGNAFRITEVEAYIKSLEKTYSILTDLRAPFQTLLNVTGSVALAQRSLEAALNISVGTGNSLATVISAISAGLRGQTKGIIALNSGIDKNIIASGDMNKIMAELEKKFSGQASARLDTYSGKMDTLKKGTEEATKIIGEGLVDALTILSEDNSIKGLSDDMENFAENIAFATTNLAKLIDKLGSVTSSASFKPALLLLGAAASALTFNPAPFLAAFGVVGAMGVAGALTKNYGGKEVPSNQKRSASRIDLLVTKARKQEYDIITKKNAIENKNVEELKKKFDLERIGITAALNSATDEETKLRLKAQLAILDNNEAMAKKLLAELEAAEALKKLAEQARLAGMGLEDFALFKVKTLNTKIDDYLQNTALEMVRALNAQIAAFIASLGGASKLVGSGDGGAPVGGGGYSPEVVQAAILDTRELNTRINDFLSGFSTGGVQRSSSQSPMDIRLTIDGGSDKLSQAIAETIQIATKNGYSTVPAGQGF